MTDKCDKWDFSHKGIVVPISAELSTLRTENARLREAMTPFVNALEACEAVNSNYPDDMSVLRASFDYYTRHLGFDNDEIVERDSVRMSDLRRVRAALTLSPEPPVSPVHNSTPQDQEPPKPD